MLSLLLALGAAVGPSHQARPNLVVFLVDDLGWQDVSLAFDVERTPQNDRFRTPNVERLAERGVRFTQGYASAPVCTPTRVALVTGQTPARLGITYWILNAGKDTSAAFEGIDPPVWNTDGLQPGAITLPALLSDAGYRTIHVGKAHLGARGTAGSDPTSLGFDVNVAGHGAGGPGSYLGKNDFSAAHRGGGRVWDVPGLDDVHGQDVYLTEVLAERACDELRAAVEAETPFFLHMAPYAVHAPIEANERYRSYYAGLHPREAAYATMVQSVDAALGRVLDTLQELGVEDDTVVVFTSDNGGLSAHGRGGEAHTHNAPLRSGKGSYYEGGVRVPWIIAAPGRTRGGAICNAPVVTHDLFPTLLSLAGVEAPAEHLVDGVDLGALLDGAAAHEDPRVLAWHQPHFWGVRGPGIEPFTSILAGDWKLIYRHRDRGFELYDLAVDLGERDDLAAARPQVVGSLADLMSAWCLDRGASLSIDTASGAPIPLPSEVLSARAREVAEESAASGG